MVNEMIRRRTGILQKKVNPYEGWTYGRIYNGRVTRNTAVTVGTSTGSKVSPSFAVTGGHTLVYNYDSQGRYPKDIMGSDYGEWSMMATRSSGYTWGGNGDNGYNGARDNKVKKVVKLASDIVSIIVCTMFGLDDFYLYDRTSGEYLYRGKNVTANSQ